MADNNEQNLREFQRALKDKFQRANFQFLLPRINNIIQSSISDNLQKGGRYGKDNIFGGGSLKWKPSKRAISQGGQTLQDTGQLAASIRVKSFFRNGKIYVTIGSNKSYAAHQHFGSKASGFKHPGGTKYTIRKVKGVTKAVFVSNKYAASHPEKIRGITKPHKINIPARPYLVLQNRDIDDIRNLIYKNYNKIFK